MLYKSFRLSLLGSVFVALVILLNACTSQSMTSGATGITLSTHTKVPSTSVTTSTLTASTLTTSTTCPTPGSGRRAFFPPLRARQNQSFVYQTHDEKGTATIHAYDTKTGKKKDIFTFSDPNSYADVESSVSPNGQWITLTSQQDGGVNKIQVVRIDGAYAQTLYCAQQPDFLQGVLLSPDQHHLAFNEKNQDTFVDTLKVLDTTTGKIQIELSSQQPGYPTPFAQLSSAGQSVATVAQQGSPTQTLKYATKRLPQPGPRPKNAYIPIKWANNHSLYVREVPMVASSGAPPLEIYQLLDIHKPVEQQSSNVKLITPPFKEDEYSSYDITSDNTQLIYTASPMTPINKTLPSISIRPITGGRFHTIFTAPANSQIITTTSRGKTLLFVEKNYTGMQLYRIQTDGTSLKLLTSTKYSSFNPWIAVSFDGKKYVIEISDNNGVNSLIIGSMNGGKTTTISTGLLLAPIGWTAA